MRRTHAASSGKDLVRRSHCAFAQAPAGGTLRVSQSTGVPFVFSHVLVTGGCGFIGSHLIRLLLSEYPGVRVTNLDALTYAGNPDNLRDVEGNAHYRFVHGNVCDANAVEATIAGGVDAVVNLAAETHVDRSILDPEAFLRTQILGTHVLLEAARSHGIARFLQVSTDEVYGDVRDGASRESDTLAPRSPYAASKAGADLQVLAYHHTYGMPVLITRGSNTYGSHQHPEKFIPLFITNLIDDEPVPLYGDGNNVRDWLHVDDHTRGVLHVLEHGDPGEVYNIGGGNPRTNRTITEQLVSLCGRAWESHVRHVTDREGHDRRYALDCAKSRALGWAPRRPLDEGLAATVQWYAQNEAWWRPLKAASFQAYYARQYAGRGLS
ncbi:MAG: dTDP-glucose 4,6-dehydratase [Candidatus Eremiobacteraeota bacterium]|nr:dTDP-glucose 4,6-dehydratase [Candidatus Eremiobacteraeota bacterium]MBV9645987.1 dTDP-glucose 4,6-dehydratase [Candidatus Eremiobacteraeota bacterium]